MKSILDPSLFNRCIMKQPFHMLTIRHVPPSDWFTSIDLRDAYFHLPIIPRHRKFLRFSFKEYSTSTTDYPLVILWLYAHSPGVWKWHWNHYKEKVSGCFFTWTTWSLWTPPNTGFHHKLAEELPASHLINNLPGWAHGLCHHESKAAGTSYTPQSGDSTICVMAPLVSSGSSYLFLICVFPL